MNRKVAEIILEIFRRANGQIPADEWHARMLAAIVTHEFRIPVSPIDVWQYCKNSKRIITRNGYWLLKR